MATTMLLGGGVASIAAQIYRYFQVSDLLQRQQTKWVILGVSGAVVTMIVFASIGPLLPSIGGSGPDPSYDLTGTTGIVLTSLFIPLTVGLAIFQSRLWDIDLVVNRTLVYGALPAPYVGEGWQLSHRLESDRRGAAQRKLSRMMRR